MEANSKVVEEVYSPGLLLEILKQRMNRNVSRSALWRWRDRLGFKYPPFYEDHVEALSIYGNLIGLGMKPDIAKEKPKLT